MKETPLSQFLTDMRYSDEVVGIKESTLRSYAQDCKMWEQIATDQKCLVNFKREIR